MDEDWAKSITTIRELLGGKNGKILIACVFFTVLLYFAQSRLGMLGEIISLWDFAIIFTIFICGAQFAMFVMAFFSGETGDITVPKNTLIMKRAIDTGNYLVFLFFILLFLSPNGVVFQMVKNYEQDAQCFPKTWEIHAYPPSYGFGSNSYFTYKNYRLNITDNDANMNLTNEEITRLFLNATQTKRAGTITSGFHD
jgi:hypothetical protein